MITKRTLSLFIALLCVLHLGAQRKVYVMNTEGFPVEGAMITDYSTGKMLSITSKQGISYLSKEKLGEVAVSHIAYKSLVSAVQDTLVLESNDKIFSEAKAIGKVADYYRLRAVVRSYQYIDNTPVNFVDGVVDFYINGKGTKLQCHVLHLDVYKNTDYIKQMKISAGMVDASSSHIINWINNPHIATKGKHFLLDSIGKEVVVRTQKEGEIVGKLTLMNNKEYVATIDLKQKKDSVPRSFFGRSFSILSHTLEQRFPSSFDVSNVRPYDLTSYRTVIHRNTWTKKHPTPVPLTDVHEVVILEKKRVSKAEKRAVKMDASWDYYCTPKSGEKVQHNIPLPATILPHIGKKLERLSEKE